MIRTLLMLAFWGVVTPLAGIICIPWTLATRDVRFLYAVGMWAARTGVRIAGLRIVPEGLDRLDPRRTYIFLSNHASIVDPPLLMPLIPRRSSVLVKKELFRIPVLGQAMRIAALVPVDRSNRESAVSSLNYAGEVLRQGINMMVFVEGTRTRDGRLLPFKKGPFYLAADNGVPVVPVTIVGSFDALPKNSFRMRPGFVRVVFHEPLDPRQFPDKEALMEAVRARIASALSS